MALTLKLTDLVHRGRDINLIYDASSNASYKALYSNTRMNIPEPAVSWHVPAEGERKAIRAAEDDRSMYFGVVIGSGDDTDDQRNAVNRLRRWVGTESSHALRYELDGDVRPLYLEQNIKETNTVIARIKGGAVLDGDATYRSTSLLNDRVVAAVLRLDLSPYSTTEKPITLRNQMSNPAFLVESGTSGLAARWNLIGTPDDQTLDDGTFLIKQSQRLDLPTSGTVGIESDLVTAAPGSTVSAYIWVQADSGCDDLTIELEDGGSNSIATKTFTEASPTTASDQSYTSETGKTFYRHVVEGTLTDADFRVRAYRDSTDASAGGTCRFDLALGQSDAETINKISNWQFDADSDNDGVADGWTDSGLAVISIDSSNYYSSPSSQEISRGAGSGAGRLGQIISAPAGTTATLKVWLKLVDVLPSVGEATITLTDGTDTSLDTITVDTTDIAANADESDTGGDSATWYRFDFTGTNNDAEDFKILLQGEGGNAFFDDISLTTDTLPTSDAWVGNSLVTNRNDSGTSNPDRHGELLIWGIPGDAEALVRYRARLENLGGGYPLEQRDKLIAGRSISGRWNAEDQIIWGEGEDGSAQSATNASWTISYTDASQSGGNYARLDATGAGSGTLRLTFTGNDARRLLAHTRRLFPRIVSDTTDATFTFTVSADYTANEQTLEIVEAKTISPNAVSTFEVQDMGTLYGRGVVPNELIGIPGIQDGFPVIHVDIAVDGLTSGEYAGVDGIYFFPADDEFMVVEPRTWTEHAQLWIDGYQKGVILPYSGVREPSIDGTLWRLSPGVTNRVDFAVLGTDDEHTLADELDFWLEVWPRTRHLLGTSIQ